MDWQRAIQRTIPFIGLVLFVIALYVLHRALRGHAYQDVAAAIKALSPGSVLAGLALTALNYTAMTGHDFLALRYLRRELPYRRIALAALTGYAFSHNLGFAMISGGSVRYRLYAGWGFSAIDVTQIVLFATVTIWVGFLTLGGLVFLFEPLPLSPLPAALPSLGPLGVLLLLLVGMYVLACAMARAPLRVRGWNLRLPSWRLALAQTALSTFDWALAAAALFVLLPPESHLSYPAFVGLFLLAQFTGVASQVPGGVGVFEGLMVVLLPGTPVAALLGSLLVFRAIYYLLPLAVAAAALGLYEVAQRTAGLARVARAFRRWSSVMAPQLLAVAAFASGAVLLFSGATPGLETRLAWLRHVIPLPVVELSHFLGSVIGMALLLLARGLQQRLDAAYLASIVLLVAGIVASLLKGLDYEEALVLGAALALLLPMHRAFYRKASVLRQSLTAGWISAIALVLVAWLWLGLFSFSHVQYSDELWWQFALHGGAPRFLRASVGVVAVIAAFGLARLLRPGIPQPSPPTTGELARANQVIDRSKSALANLALLGDKQLLFSDDGRAFIMYGIAGRSFVALGDPVGPRGECAELAWRFNEYVDLHAGWPVFYQVSQASLPLYVDLGLSPIKFGEEAHVRLMQFSLSGRARKGLRHLHNRVARTGVTFEIAPAEAVPSLLPDLQRVSQQWLAAKRTREKRFSLGYFDPAYLVCFPMALVRDAGAIVAFANVLQSAERAELSVDLMRYVPSAPDGVMDFLLTELMLWGRAEGFGVFNLGMAPLSGLREDGLAPLWNQIGSLVYAYGESLYGFQGLRQFKDKYEPAWSPRYIACPGGIALAPILANITALVSGGLAGAIKK